MRSYRIASQIAFFSVYSILFSLFAGFPLAYAAGVESFLRVNPLVALTASIASRSLLFPIFLVSLPVLAGSIVFGRFFCGFVCPLGAMIDFVDRFVVRTVRPAHERPPLHLQRVKYVLLAVIIVLAFMGVLFPLFMDPISLLTRLWVILGFPLARIISSDIVSGVRGPLSALGWDKSALITISVPVFYGGFTALLLAVVIFGSGLWDRRFWCQYLCPTGAFLGLLGRFAPFRRLVVKGKCNDCSLCARACPTRAINAAHIERTRVPECILCGICTEKRKVGCSSFAFSVGAKTSVGPDLARRHILSGALGGAILLPIFRAAGLAKHDGAGRLLRPPGALPEVPFLARCLGCGECMKACPTNAIQPCTATDGVHRIFTPRIVPRIGGCEEKCYLCGHVCPTGALRPLSHDQKEFAKIGTAVIDRHRCLAWAQNKECVVCDEICPYNAIEARLLETTKGLFKVPVVTEDLCLGCGMCEQKCPIDDDAAIVVYRFSENRRATGDYVTPWQKEAIRTRRRRSDRKGLDTGPQSEPDSGRMHQSEPDTGGADEGLPPGFLEG